MSYASKLQIKESLEILKTRYSKEKDSRSRLRIKSLILYKLHPQKRQEDIASHLCISHPTIKRWYREYREKGFDYFIREKRQGGNRPSVISEDIHTALSQKLSDSHNPFLGYWDAVHWLQEEYKVKVGYHTLRAYMKRHNKIEFAFVRACFLG